MIYSMGGTHAEAVRRQVEVAVKDVRHSRSGRYADIMVERIRELKLERGRIGLMEIDPRHGDYMPVNQYNVLRENLARGRADFHQGLPARAAFGSQRRRARLRAQSRCAVQERHGCDGRAGASGREGIRAARRCRLPPSWKAAAISIFSLSARRLWRTRRDLWQSAPVIAGAAKGRHHQHGACRRLSRLHRAGRFAHLHRRADRDGEKFWKEVTLPGYRRIVAEIAPGKPCEAMRVASKFFRDNGYQSRPIQCHGIDLVTDGPHVAAEHVSAEEFEQVLKPGMVIMAEPNPITPDGLFGIFLGHTFIVTDSGHEVVDDFPLEIAVARS